ncbi:MULTISPECIES: MATE family efflux transporter [unclassified Ruegeria]|uniref:MATE family efflux transporter n=1 Tax=unclassified Ruegeria TaxID=2625375 RepID=UPI00149146D1|nr:MULTISPECIES: MATE family efflux transporter [unclassified Ruegeria]NOD87947.1 MATE family efflux transporter [Ruegeria sp. HKCCD4318]NOE14317.1 MATE family efflux transporter [Ruegeria sp. HKCCD4318-2]NOG08326.1 MATE family efflux transporter [Ruegeria sp. HKCCD4315]
MQDASAPITHRRVLKIAVPIVLSNATVPILGAVDTGVVGQMGQAAPIGAVGMGAVILASIYWIFGFLRMGTTGLAAQARGAGDVVETRALLIRGLMLGAAAGVFFVLAQAAVFAGAFALSPASPEVEALTRAYLEIRIWGAPATIALYAVTGWLIAVERTRGVFVLQIWMNGLNIVLDLWFVLGLGWGVEGVAVATLIAEWTGLALGLWLCRDGFEGKIWRDRARIFDAARLRRMMQVNGDIMIRSVLLTGSFTTFLFVGADLGDVNLAANQVLLQFLEITAFALDGFAFSAEALVGSAVGARDRYQLRRASIMASQWGLGGAILLGAVFFLAGPSLIDLMSTSPEVRLASRDYLFWAALAPVVGVASWMFDGIYIGATWTRAMRNAMIQSVAIYVVALFVLVPSFGNHGLWAALMVLNIARGATMGWRYPKLEAQVA